MQSIGSSNHRWWATASNRETAEGDRGRSHPAGAPPDRWRRRRASIRLVFSVALLAGVTMASSFPAAVGAGTVGQPQPSAFDYGRSWGAFVEDARLLHYVIQTEESTTTAQRASADRWAPQVARLADELSLLLAAEGPATGGRTEAARADLQRQQGAVNRSTGDPEPRSVGEALDHLIEDAAVLAVAEREVRMGELEAASRASVRVLGHRTLVIALMAVGAAVAMIGLTLSISELRAARIRRPPTQPSQPPQSAVRVRIPTVAGLARRIGSSAAMKPEGAGHVGDAGVIQDLPWPGSSRFVMDKRGREK